MKARWVHQRHPVSDGPVLGLAPVDGPAADDPAKAPSQMSARPRGRLVWSGVWLICALLCLAVGARLVTGAEPEPELFLLAIAAAMVCCVSAALGLRWGIVADEDGIVVCRSLSSQRVAWSDLEDVELELIPAEVSLGFHRLILVTRERPRVVAPFTGLNRTGAPLPELRTTLLSMRARYLTQVPVRDDLPGTVGGVTGDVPEAVDRVSLTALVLSVLGMALVAVPMALWGLVRGGPGTRRGQALAVAALFISAVWVVAATAVLVGTGRVGSGTNPSRIAGDASLWPHLLPGTCVPFPPSYDPDVPVVDCGVEEEHEEVMGRTTMAGPATWPTWGEFDEAARAACRPVFEEYMGVPHDDTRWWIDYLTVDESAWGAGEGTVICLVWDPYAVPAAAPVP